MSNIESLRHQVDSLDQQLLTIINQRAQLAINIGTLKQETGNSEMNYKPEQEAQILNNIIAKNNGPLSNQQINQIFRNILMACLSLQQMIKVAYLGPEGTYSQAAVFKHFGVATNATAVTSIERIFREVESDNADYGIVPIENTTTGMITISLDLLMKSTLSICGESIIPIHHHLISKCQSIATISRIYSHEQSFLQCHSWLSSHMPHAELIPVASNGAAVKQAKFEANCAAIAGDLAAHLNQLPILVHNIEDNAQNKTRFLVIGKQKTKPSGQDKTTLTISTGHSPGSLLDILTPFKENNINLIAIESRPSNQRNWSYSFFIDFIGHQDDVAVQKALATLAERSFMLNILGSYPRAQDE